MFELQTLRIPRDTLYMIDKMVRKKLQKEREEGALLSDSTPPPESEPTDSDEFTRVARLFQEEHNDKF